MKKKIKKPLDQIKVEKSAKPAAKVKVEKPKCPDCGAYLGSGHTYTICLMNQNIFNQSMQ